MKRTLLLMVLALLVAAGTAHAGLIFVPDTYGLSARSIALGNAMTAVGDDYSMAYFNPASLGALKSNQVDLGYLYAVPNFQGGPKHGSHHGGGEGGDGDAVKFDTANRITFVGFTMNLSTLFEKEHGVGLGFDIAIDNNLKSFLQFEDTRSDKGQFVRYGLSSVTMTTGLGIQIIPELYVGGGGFVMVKGKNQLVAQTDMAGNTSKQEIQVEAQPAIAPIASIYAPVHRMVTIGATWRGKGVAEFSQIKAATEATVSESPLTQLNLLMAFKDTYVPQQAVLGIAVRPFEGFLAAADMTWANWGDYDNEVKKGDVVKANAEFRTVDTYTPRVGFEYMALKNLALRLGYSYQQTPFKKPGLGDTVVLDNDKHVASVGLGHDMDYLSFMRYPISLGATYFYHALVPRTVKAADGRKFESQGNLQGLAGTLTLRF